MLSGSGNASGSKQMSSRQQCRHSSQIRCAQSPRRLRDKTKNQDEEEILVWKIRKRKCLKKIYSQKRPVRPFSNRQNQTNSRSVPAIAVDYRQKAQGIPRGPRDSH